MYLTEEKINTIRGVLEGYVSSTCQDSLQFEYTEGEYKLDNNTPPSDGWRVFDEGQRLSGIDKHFWFRTKFKTPAAIEGKEIYFDLKTGREGQWDAQNPQCILYLNGKAAQGMDVNHTDAPLEFDTEYDLTLYFYTGMNPGYMEFIPTLKLVDIRIQHLFYDISVPYNSAICFHKTDDNYIKTIRCLELAVNLLDLRKPFSDDFYKSVDAAIDFLYKEFYNGICGESEAIVSCIGHTHIDVAWLWTLAQTAEKSQRSFSTVINLMKKYPEFKFMSSQPVLYKYVKTYMPDLYEEIKEAVKDGRWEIEGAMFVEADCNLCSGESLIRQIIHGKRFFMQEFGVDSKVLWLPDVFGYSAALPQILQKCGVNKFLTSKISWSEYNKLPYDTFMWEGIDGTEIFTSFITTRDHERDTIEENISTYVGYIRPTQVLGTWKRYQQKEYNNETILTFGFGDGGGGPTADMLEQQRRLQYGLPGIPKTRIERAGVHLDNLQRNFEKSAAELKRTPRWVGELYLELHRGTYTSIAKNKRNNRKSEIMYQELEAVSVTESLLCGGVYPQADINESWETIIINQFHDIIPGSSIKEVYDDCDKAYAEVLGKGGELLAGKLSGIAKNIKTDGGVMVYNPLSFATGGIIDKDGKKAYVSDIPAFGWKIANDFSDGGVSVSGNTVENKSYKMVIDEKGCISSLYDKRFDREVVKPGCTANEIQVFEDLPKCYDAWEITKYYKSKMWTVDDVISITPIDEGARAGFEIKKKFLDSEIVQRIYMYGEGDRIDFENTIDWKESHLLVKAAFPLNVHADKATYDIQFGNLERPTHENTSWDGAKFEVCAHKWADISEDDYGVSLLNDCKYGYNAEGSTLKLTMLKCATDPNPEADKEIHTFTYSLYPHGGSFKSGGTVREAYRLNQPLMSLDVPKQDGTLEASHSMLSCENENIIIETMKKAEDSGDIIIRLYDTFNRSGKVRINTGFDFKKAYLCDMLENNISELDAEARAIEIPVGTYEIVTLKLTV